VFEEIIRRCVGDGQWEGERRWTLAVNGSIVAADASQQSRSDENSCGTRLRCQGPCAQPGVRLKHRFRVSDPFIIGRVNKKLLLKYFLC
jgi:hypothetical protein